MVLHCFAHFRQGNGIASVEKQFNIRTCQFLGNRAANSTARTGDEIAFHELTGNYCRGQQLSNLMLRLKSGAPHSESISCEIFENADSVSRSFWNAHASSRRFRMALRSPQGKPVICRLP